MQDNEPSEPSQQGQQHSSAQGKLEHEAQLFEGSSDKAKQLFADAKRVRRTVARKTWWNEHKPKS